jgi:hypothetical protein
MFGISVLMRGGRRVKVIIYGLFPTSYSLCAPCCTYNYLSACRPGYVGEEESEYPEWVRGQQEFIARLLPLLSSYGKLVDVRVVSADSLKGVYLAIRHRLGLKPAIIVNGRVFRGDSLNLEEVKEFIDREVRRAYSEA